MKEITISSSAGFLCRAELADNLWTRGWGLLGRKQLAEEQGIWIRPCKSIHTLFMRFPIDLVYVSVDGTVVKTCSGIQPFQFSLGGKQAHSALELPAGFLSRKPITVGEKLVVGPAGYKAGQSSAEELDGFPGLVSLVPNPGPFHLRRWLRRGAGERSAQPAEEEAQRDAGADQKNRGKKNRPPGKRFSLSVLSVDDTEFPEVGALFGVDLRGRAASNIDPSQLRIQEGGAPASLSTLQRVVDPDMPLSLVIAMNIGWLTDGANLNKAREFATNLIDKLGPHDAAAVMIFDEEETVHQGFTSEKARLKEAVAGLGPGRKAGLPDIVAEVAQFALESEERRLAVVLVMDSCEFLSRSKLSKEKSLRLAHNSGCPFFAVGIGAETDPTQDGHIYLSGLTNPSGGQLLEDVETWQAAEVYASLEELLRSIYLATFRASSPTILHDRSLSLSLGKGAACGSASVTYVTKRIEHWKAAFLAANQNQRRQESFQVLFPSPQFVVPLAFPAIMFGVGIGLGMKGTFQLLGITWHGTIGAGRHLFGRQARMVVPVLPKDNNRMEPRSSGGRLSNHSDQDHADAGSFPSQATVLVTSALDEDRSYRVVGEPATIGSGARCDIRLPAAPGVFTVHARMWWRDGRLMLHHLAPGQVTIVSRKHIIWTTLEDGDEAAIGPYLLRIALQGEEIQPAVGIGLAESRRQDAYSGSPLIRAS